MTTHRDYVLKEIHTILDSLTGTKVLELGSGHDNEIKHALVNRGFIDYYSTDPYTNSKMEFEGTTIHSDNFMEDLSDFKDNMFDLVISCHSFEHCERPVDALKEALRVLKPGGTWLSATPFPCAHHILEADEDHIMVLHPMQIKRLLQYTGFKRIVSYVSQLSPLEQDYNVISMGEKNET